MILAGVAIFNTAFFGVMVWFLIDELIGRVAGIDSAVAHAEEALRAGQVDTLLWAVLLSAVYGVALFALGVVLSHRIAGPLTRVLEELSRLAAGETPARIRLRDTDLLQPYAEEVNYQLEQISMGRAHATIELRSLVEKLSASELPPTAELRAELQKMIEMLHPTAAKQSEDGAGNLSDLKA